MSHFNRFRITLKQGIISESTNDNKQYKRVSVSEYRKDNVDAEVEKLMKSFILIQQLPEAHLGAIDCKGNFRIATLKYIKIM